jgi:hypothetical protein
MQVAPHPQPPKILQIFREPLKPGAEAAYCEIEEDTARLAAELGCPHPYLGIESLTGSKEAWWFNGYESLDEHKRVVEDYQKNAPLLGALERNSKRKASLTLAPSEVFAAYRPDLSRGVPWILGQGRVLVITATRDDREGNGTVFEAKDGTRFAIRAARSREEAEQMASSSGSESSVFAIRPSWSFPAKEWVAWDREFWGGSASSRQKAEGT